MKLKRNPGELLQEKRLNLIPNVVLPVMVGAGLLCGACLVLLAIFVIRLFPEQTFLGTLLPILIPLPSLLLFIYAWYKYKGSWQLPNIEKGELAERKIAQAIENALTREACAVAHNVKEVARYGDIDHLVATPHGLWVIETKYRRVPSSEFPETLERIAANVETVRKWAPTGTQVTGCLVFANKQEKPLKQAYKARKRKERIRAFDNPADLEHELRKEENETGDSRDLARRVRELS